MRLLVVTQAIDADDPVLGFFVNWVAALVERTGELEVVCLAEGAHALPGSVRIHSLGKERGQPLLGRLAYAWRFLRLAWRLRHRYDAVFVHMNQEYVLIAGPLWRVLGKRVYLWRNHFAGSWATDLAAVFATKVFCTSRYSYTARYKKTVIMPVGVDMARFSPDPCVLRTPRSILFLARLAPAKRPEMLIEALALLAKRGEPFTATIVGSPGTGAEAYAAGLHERVRAAGLEGRVRFAPGVLNRETPALYRAHEIFVNTSPSGMLDKTIFEAAACGAAVFAASDDYATLAGAAWHFGTAEELAERLAGALGKPVPRTLAALAKRESLTALVGRLVAEMQAIAPAAGARDTEVTP